MNIELASLACQLIIEDADNNRQERSRLWRMAVQAARDAMRDTPAAPLENNAAIPGPYVVETYASGELGIESPTHGDIADMVEAARDITVTVATAQLLAASPDLLAACKCAVAALSQNATYPGDCEMAKRVLRDAIAKAESR